MTCARRVVLATSDYYLPGYKGGGSIHALANMVCQLGDAWTFKVVTRDHDCGEPEAYSEILPSTWWKQEKAEVFYLAPASLGIRVLFDLVRRTTFDVLYHNSFFSPVFTFYMLLLRRFGLIPARPTIIAPRGEFSPGALEKRKLKKLCYVFLVKALGLCHDVTWHASTEHEEANIRRWFGDKARVIVARDCLPSAPILCKEIPVTTKIKGQLVILFLSRISRMKNLHGALAMLCGLQGEVYLHIYGPKEDPAYWEECQTIIDQLPQNIVVEYRGPIEHDQVLRVMASHHLFFLPTHGENFGFAIFEALVAGCPVLISDRTPWQNLQEQGVGWALSLGEPEQFQRVLQACINMDEPTFLELSRKAREYGLQMLRNDVSAEQNRMLFEVALQSKAEYQKVVSSNAC